MVIHPRLSFIFCMIMWIAVPAAQGLPRKATSDDFWKSPWWLFCIAIPYLFYGISICLFSKEASARLQRSGTSAEALEGGMIASHGCNTAGRPSALTDPSCRSASIRR